MSTRTFVFVLALTCMLSTLPCLSWAQKPADSSDAEAELDAQLLEDLGGDLLEEIAPQGVLRAAPAPAEESGPGELDEDLRQSLGEPAGEDIGQSSPGDDPHAPLEEIGTQMRSAQRMLAERDALGRATRLQDKIVQDLEALIKKVQRQKKQSQQGGKPSPGSQRSTAKPQGSQSGQSSAEGQAPAADSSDQLREGTSEGASGDRQALRSELLKDLWGHLPERAREQMLQSSDDEFLPEYELEIEQYFRRLAEDPDLDGS